MFYGGDVFQVAVQEIVDEVHAKVMHRNCKWYSNELMPFKIIIMNEGDNQQQQHENKSSDDNNNEEEENKEAPQQQKPKGNKFVTEVYDYENEDNNTLFHTGDQIWFYHASFVHRNRSTFVKEFRIYPKHKNIKIELLSNKYHRISMEVFDGEVKKAALKKEFKRYRKIKCTNSGSIENMTQFSSYSISNKNNSLLGISHLITVIFYCNNDQMQWKFKKRLRAKKKEKRMKAYSEIFHWLRLLTECVKYFGRPISNRCSHNTSVLCHYIEL